MNFRKIDLNIPKPLVPILFSITALLFIIILSLFPFVDEINNTIYDSYTWVRYKRSLSSNKWEVTKGNIDTNIVIISIDHKSLNYMSKRVGDYPWPRSVYGDIVNKLKQNRAKSIFFDIQFSERQLTAKERLEKILINEYKYSKEKASFLSDQVFIDFSDIKQSFEFNSEKLESVGIDVNEVISALNIVYNNNDLYFIKSVRDAKNVFLPFLSLKKGDFKYTKETLKIITKNSIPVDESNSGIKPWAYSLKLPIPSLIKYSKSVNNVSYITFRNEINRDIPVVIRFNKQLYPHIGISLINHFYDDSLNNVTIDYPRHKASGQLQLNNYGINTEIDSLARVLVSFRGGEKDFKHLSFSDFLYPKNDSLTNHYNRLVKDKIVMIGATAPILRDVIETPLGLMPGIIYHANFLNNLFMNDFVYKISTSINFIILFFILALLAFIFYYHSNIYTDFIIFLFSLATAVIASYMLFELYSIYLHPFAFIIGIALIFIGISTFKLMKERVEKSGILNTFEKYVSSNIVKELLDNPEKIKLGGELRNISILFSDIRSFTSFSEKRKPEEVIERLNHFFTEMTDVIYDSNGTLDKYIGDEIMALFGAPVFFEDHKYKACLAAASMIKKLHILEEEWTKNGEEPFGIGIGINSGEVIVGNIGSSKIMDYTVIGDNVNLAARVEALTREYNSQLLITEYTYKGIENLVEVEFIDSVKVKGKNNSVKIYRLLSITDTEDKQIIIS